MQSLLKTIEEVIEVEDFGKALEIIEEENITDASMNLNCVKRCRSTHQH